MTRLLVLLSAVLFLSACSTLGGYVEGFGFDIKLRDGKAPTHAQVVSYNKAQKVSAPQDVLINGTAVPNKDYPAIVMITSGNAGCTGTVVGPRVLITAAHCAETGAKVSFKALNGKVVTGTAEQSSLYKSKDLDINLVLLDTDAPDMMSVTTVPFEKKNPGTEVQLIGYGCIKIGGGGGNDGVLRSGLSNVVGAQGYDLELYNGDTGAALCYGDSGGPVLYPSKAAPKFVTAINSKGNIKDRNWVTRLTNSDADAFLKDFASRKSVGICGINLKCDGSTPSPTPPSCTPKQIHFKKRIN
jgi:hypothetical protein